MTRNGRDNIQEIDGHTIYTASAKA